MAALRAAIEQANMAGAQGARAAVERMASRGLAWARRREGLGLVVTVAAAVGIALAVRARGAEAYEVVTASMVPTLHPEDRVVGNKLAYANRKVPRRSDVIVFASAAVGLGPAATSGMDVLVKRVVGVPGDRIGMHGSVPVINGWEVPACTAGDYFYVLPDGSGHWVRGRIVVEFLDDHFYLTIQPLRAAPFPEEYVVKPGEVFVLGDNRANSLDSRAYHGGRGGGVPLSAVRARAQWFLTGHDRSGDDDLSHLFQSLDAPQPKLQPEGVDAGAIARGVARCLAHRPTETHPPAGAAAVGRDRAL